MTDLEKKAAEKAEEIVASDWTMDYSGIQARDWRELINRIATALVAFAEEALAAEFAKGALDQQKRCDGHQEQAKAEGRREGLLRAAEIAGDCNEAHSCEGAFKAAKIRSLAEEK